MADAAKLPSLTVLSGPLAGTRFDIEDAVDNILIGSDPSCRFSLDVPAVSPIHARLWIDLSGITVYDTNSPHGLYVNDDRVAAQAPLHNGDILWLGRPGEELSTMLQCRVPVRSVEQPAPSPPAFDPDANPSATVAFMSPFAAGALPAMAVPESAPPPAPDFLEHLPDDDVLEPTLMATREELGEIEPLGEPELEPDFLEPEPTIASRPE